MLAKMQTRMAYHVQALISSMKTLRAKPIANLMTMMVIGITLTLPAIFWLLADNMQQMSSNWQQSGHISLYLDASTSPAEESSLLARVRDTAGVGEVKFISSAEGLAELQQQEGMHDIMQYLPENPLPTVIDVLPALNVSNPSQLENLYQVLQAYPHVEQAKFDMQWINRLNTLVHFVSTLAHVLMSLLAFAVVMIIMNTLRLAIQNRQEEMVVLKLIGASNGYITRPFLYLGMCYAIGGAILAIVLVNSIILSFGFLVNQLAEAYEMHYRLQALSMGQILTVVLFAMVLGWLGARLSVRSLCRLPW